MEFQMLFADTEESIDLRVGHPSEVIFRESMTGVINRIKDASIFVLDPQAIEMGVNVFLGKPSSILSALPFVKLPAPSVWIEFSNFASRNAFKNFGNPNPQMDNSVIIEKTGFLLSETDGKIKMEMIAQYQSDQKIKHIELLSSVCEFDTTQDFETLPTIFPSIVRDVPDDATGKAAAYYKMLTNNETEYEAKREIGERFSGYFHPDIQSAMNKVNSGISDSDKIKFLNGHISDMERLFTMQILPTLILLNCRNAVNAEHVPAPEKLNKKRRKKGRPEIKEYNLVKLHLKSRGRKTYETSDNNGKQTSGGIVIGHFKVRKTGVYWWSPYWRGPTNEQTPRRISVITN